MNRGSEESFFLYHNFTPRRGDRSIGRGERSSWIWMPSMALCAVTRKDASSMVTTAATAIGRHTSSAAVTCSRPRLRRNIDAAAVCVEEVSRIVNHLRGHWLKLRMVLRADWGFACDALMSWCEAHQVDFVFGLAKNDRLKAHIITETAKAQAACEKSGQPARRFRNFSYRTLDSWSRERRVMGKAEYLPAKPTRALS